MQKNGHATTCGPERQKLLLERHPSNCMVGRTKQVSRRLDSISLGATFYKSELSLCIEEEMQSVFYPMKLVTNVNFFTL